MLSVSKLYLRRNHLEANNISHLCVCFSAEMMGHPELSTECNINQLEPLLPQDVVDDLLSKYVQTFTVRTHKSTACPVLMASSFSLRFQRKTSG